MGSIPWAWQYRRVVYKTSQGEEKVAWARLYFNDDNKNPKVDWEPKFTDTDIEK
jgi:hypothetical protein